MASQSIGCPSSSFPMTLPAGAGLRRSPSSVDLWLCHNGTRQQQQQARRLVMAAAARRRYRGTVRREAALAELVERKVAEAMQACGGKRGQDDEVCRVAWDQVEEVSRARADFRRRIAEAPGDPLEPFCVHNPTAGDCAVVYVDD